jgi:hypothetical protein
MAKAPAAAAPAAPAVEELPPIDDTAVDDDALPPWPATSSEDEGDDGPPDAETPVEKAARLKAKTEAPGPDGDAPPAPDGAADAPAPAPSGAPDTAAPIAPAAPSALGSSQRQLARFGWTPEQIANTSEDQAADWLAQAVEQQFQVVNANQHLIRLGQAAQEKWDQIAPILSGQPAPAAPAAPPTPKKPGVAESFKKRLESVGPKPDYDPMWERAGLQTDGTHYFAPANAPHLQPYADKLNNYRKWERTRTEVLHEALPDVIEQLETVERAPPPGAMTQEQFEQELAKREKTKETQQFVASVNQQCGAWMFELGRDNQPLRDPRSGDKIPTTLGKQYFQYCQHAMREGMASPQSQHTFAMLAMGEALRQRAPIDSAAPTAPSSAPASSVAPAAAAAGPVSKAQQKARATRQPIAAVAAGLKPATPTRLPSMGEMLAERFSKLPEDAFGAPDDDGEQP